MNKSDYIKIYQDCIQNIPRDLINTKTKTLVALILLNVAPVSIANQSDNIIADPPKQISNQSSDYITKKDSTYIYDVLDDDTEVDIKNLPLTDIFWPKVFEIVGLKPYQIYDIGYESDSIGAKIPLWYRGDLPQHQNKIRTDILMDLIDRSYKSNYSTLQYLYDHLDIEKEYRYPIFQKLNIMFDGYAQKQFDTKDVYLYDRSFFDVLYHDTKTDSVFCNNVSDYFHIFKKKYTDLQDKAPTKLQFQFSDSAQIKNYSISFDNKIYVLPGRLDFDQAKKELDNIGVSVYSSSEFDRCKWDRYWYYETSLQWLSSIIPKFLTYLQEDMREKWFVLWDEDKLVVRWGTEYSHSDYFISANKKTITTKSKSGKKTNKIITHRVKNHIFDYKDDKLPDIKKKYLIDDNIISGRYIDKIITKHQLGYSIDIQSRWAVWVALSAYTGVRSTSYNFKNKDKTCVKHLWPKWEITWLFTYHDNHFHILVLPTDLYKKIEKRLR